MKDKQDYLINIGTFDNNDKKGKRINVNSWIIFLKNNLLKILSITIVVVLLNIFFTRYLLVFLVQFTVGFGGNMLWLHDEYVYPSSPYNLKIPKIIHQTWFDNNKTKVKPL